MKKVKPIVAHNAMELAEAIGMSRSDGHRWELRSQLITQIIGAVKKSHLTHIEVAKRAKTSRTRITSILNRNVDDVSTDLLLRIIDCLGYKVKLSVYKEKLAA
jgi:predicted XRE-type DNA-binding protein